MRRLTIRWILFMAGIVVFFFVFLFVVIPWVVGPPARAYNEVPYVLEQFALPAHMKVQKVRFPERISPYRWSYEAQVVDGSGKTVGTMKGEWAKRDARVPGGHTPVTWGEIEKDK